MIFAKKMFFTIEAVIEVCGYDMTFKSSKNVSKCGGQGSSRWAGFDQRSAGGVRACQAREASLR
jgi:hypothetical protein